MNNICPSCGNDKLNEQPYEEDGYPSYEICACCGFQFGYTDDDSGYTFEQWREKWIREGMVYDNGNSEPPENWDPVQQLRNIGVIIDIH